MSGYDQFVAKLERSEIEAKAIAWRIHFGAEAAWVPDIPRILERELPQLMPNFAVRVWARGEMPDEEARTWHAVPSIDFREDVYEQLCRGIPRARFTAAHELGHLFLHNGESRPRAVAPIRARTIPRSMSSEGQANDFAASFLMPEFIVRDFGSPADLASGCQVSPMAAEIRMRELRVWPKKKPPVPEVEEYLREMKAGPKRRK